MKLRKSELLAILLTLACIAAATGYQIGLRRSAPAFSVATGMEAGTRLLPSAVPADGGSGFADTAAVDINTAGPEELKTLSGIGDALAERIVAYREEHGPFRRVEDLTRVSGVGVRILEENTGRITVGTEENAA